MRYASPVVTLSAGTATKASPAAVPELRNDIKAMLAMPHAARSDNAPRLRRGTIAAG